VINNIIVTSITVTVSITNSYIHMLSTTMCNTAIVSGATTDTVI